MTFLSFRLIFAFCLFFSAAVCVSAQIDFPDASTPNGRSNQRREDMPKNVKESLAKNRIEREEKDYQELLDRADEAAKLSDEIQNSFNNQKKLSNADRKNLEKLEKLVKKIRKDIGGGDADEDETLPKNVNSALVSLRENSSNLVDELKKATRYSISVSAIEKTNQILKILQFIQGGKN